MKKYGVLGNLLKYCILALLLIAPSLIMISKTFADNSGGYPWSDAETINQYTYDWGYPSCRTEIDQAGRCNTHVQYKWGIKYMQSDPWGYDIRNCTSYVAWRVNRDYGISVAGWGNANNWDKAARNKYAVDNIPRVGSIAVWEGLYGHVGYITKVNPDNTFEIDQYNNAGTGEFSHQFRKFANSFIHIQLTTNSLDNTSMPEVSNNELQSLVPEPASKPKPEPIILTGQSVPDLKQAEFSSNPFPNNNNIEYFIKLTPISEEINIYAVAHNNTLSGNIEVYQSTLADGNSKFSDAKIAKVQVIDKDFSKFELADYNKDRILDLYIIKTKNTPSQKVEINILDGAQDYQSTILETITAQDAINNNDSIYKIADKNNDTILDIYRISNQATSNKTKFEIFDGAENYKDINQTWNSEKPNIKLDYLIGDDNRDGINDIYVIDNNVNNLQEINIEIFDVSTEYLKSSRKLTLSKTEKL